MRFALIYEGYNVLNLIYLRLSGQKVKSKKIFFFELSLHLKIHRSLFDEYSAGELLNRKNL